MGKGDVEKSHTRIELRFTTSASGRMSHATRSCQGRFSSGREQNQTFPTLVFQIVLTVVMNRFLFACTLGACALSAALSSKAGAAPRVSLFVGDARLVEPPSGQKSIVFPVTMSRVWSEDVRVSFVTAPSNNTFDSSTRALSGFDFTSREGQITIPAGTTRAQIEVPVLADSEVEKNETFTLQLNNLIGTDNTGASVVLGRSVATGTIIEGVKGIVLGGKVIAYTVDTSPFGTDDSFDTPAKAIAQSGVTVTVSSDSGTRRATTDDKGNFSVLVLPGTYSVQVEDFSRQNFNTGNGDQQLYSMPARRVSLSRDSRSNNFAFYGIAGTVGTRFGSTSTRLSSAFVQVEARPEGADPSSTPVAVGITNFSDPSRTGRGSRFFIPALPFGRYTLSVKDVGDNTFYSTFFTFPSVTVAVPTTSGVNRPVAHVEIAGDYNFSFQSTRKSNSAPSS